MKLVEGLYLEYAGSSREQLIYVLNTNPYPMCLNISKNTVLQRNTEFRFFNANSIFGRNITLLIPCKISDGVLISSLYPELFI